MELDPILLSRIQFAFVITFHIVFPAFTIGLAAWLGTIETAARFTGAPIYRKLFDFWLKIFALSFGMGVVSGIVMAFQFGTNWSVLAERTGSIQGPLLGYEAFTAFLLEATFFGIVLFGRSRLPSHETPSMIRPMLTMIRKPKNGIRTGGRSSTGNASSPVTFAVQFPAAMKLPSVGISSAKRLRCSAVSGQASSTSEAGCWVCHRASIAANFAGWCSST